MRTYDLLIKLEFIYREDRNNNQLFEGDVIKLDNGELYVIFFKSDENVCGFIASQKFGLEPYIDICNNDYEKIGNIYLNPEISDELAKEFKVFKTEV